MFPVPVPAGFNVIAHRGASGYAPENTRAAFALAAEMGAGDVELDVQLSADGVPLLCHDTTLERYGHGPRAVEACAAAELLALDMGSFFSPYFFAGEKMLTLEGLFEAFGEGFTYHVEIKGKAPGLPRRTVDAIASAGLEGRCVLTSFSYAALEAAGACCDLPLGWLVQEIDDDSLRRAEALNLRQLCPRADRVDAGAVQKARRAVAQVRAWGGSGRPEEVAAKIRNAAGSGCDGITLNWPDWAAAEKRDGG